MGEALISIIVPVFNVEKYLKVCLDSIINQTYSNIEIILVNDGSTDSSYEICKEYVEYDNRIILINKKNEGLSSARQAGINKARGYFLCTVDSDDYIERDFVKKMHLKIEKEETDICICAIRQIQDKSTLNILGFKDSKYFKRKVTKQDVEFDYTGLLNRFYMSDSWNKMYRSDFIKSTGIKFSLEKKYNGTDLLFNHKLLLHLPAISIVDEPLYNYHILNNSRVRRKNKQLQKGFMIIFDEIMNEVNRLNYSEKIDAQLSILFVNFQRTAAQDLFNEEVNINELKEKLKEFLVINNLQLSKHKRLNLRIKDMNTLSLKIFCYLLKKDSTSIMKYLKFRQALIYSGNKIKGKYLKNFFISEGK